jgi:arylamine N-acetyltransferase
MDADLDLPAYLARIGYTGPSEPSFAVLRELNARHVAQIPFECLDPFLGLPVDLDPAALQAKLVRARRGGYCQEHNALFHDVLSTLGFSVVALAGRVVWAFKGQPAPLTHRLTLVELPEGNFIVDVGFGGQSPTAPLRLEPGLEQATPHGTYRLAREGEGFGLQLQLNDRWETMYQFTLSAQTRIDFEVANWFTSTHSSRKTSLSAVSWARLGSICGTQTFRFGTPTDMWCNAPSQTLPNWDSCWKTLWA